MKTKKKVHKKDNTVVSTNVTSSENKPLEKPIINKNETVAPIDFVVSGKTLMDMNLVEMLYLLNPLFPKTGLVAIAGSSEAGKSSFLRQLAVAIVRGDTHFLGFELNAIHKRVLYVCTEDDKNAISMLLHKQNPKGLRSEEIENLGYIFDTSHLLQKLNRVLEKHNVDCLIIDAFTDLFDGDMNMTNQIRRFLHEYAQLAEKNQTLVIFLHHTGKRTEILPPSKNNLLGSQGFEAKMRLVIEIRKDRIDKRFRHLCIVKGNYLHEDYKDRSFKLLFDDTMSFSYTNERVPFDILGSNENSSFAKSNRT